MEDSGGDLNHVLSTRGRELGLAKKLRIATEVAEGMAFLHSRNCLHLDLKTHNILVRMCSYRH